jgi:hypothetical protein
MQCEINLQENVLSTVPFRFKNIHHCPAVAIFPQSYNFTSSILQCMEDSFGHRAFDTFVVPGFSNKLSRESRTVLETLDLSYKKHFIEEMVIFQHVDFHNNGHSSRFASVAEEDCYHKNGLILSLKMLRKRYPKLNIRLVYTRLIDEQREMEFAEIFECGRERVRMIAPYKFKGILGCDGAVIMCLDFRFRKESRVCVRDSLKILNFDLIGIPGATKSFLENARISWKAVQVAYEKHNCRKFIIVHHMDCGAYGGSVAFSDAFTEELYHCEQMRSFKKRLLDKYLDVEVKIIFARLVDAQAKIQFIQY